ncbi:MAG TPA: TIGR01459 family HAD-type hydrolase [Stellaceae bacterium]|nr:TIGR01459 family HAD-type hydrolase [Stellaceae bacterium]
MTARLFSGVAELAARYDGFILDLWGVIHDGLAPLPGALDCMAALLAAHKRIALLSNAPRRADDVVRRITKIGVPPGLYHHVMSSGEEAWQCLHRRDDPFYAGLGRHCLQLGSERDLEIRDGLDLDFVATPQAADFILNTGPAGWRDRVEDYEPLLRGALARHLPMVCANPDLVVNHGGDLALCAGALAQRYESIGGFVRWHGKPYPSVYDTSLALLGIADRRRVLAVGDSLRTDLAGAEGAGLDSLLVAGGIHAQEFGAVGDRPLDMRAIGVALARGPYRPIGIVRRFSW